MPNFLLVFNRRTGERSELQEFANAGDAIRARFELEQSHRGEPDVEVVVLTARSESEIRRTHSRYFETVDELTQLGS